MQIMMLFFDQNTHPCIRVFLSWGDAECCWWNDGGGDIFMSKQLRGKNLYK